MVPTLSPGLTVANRLQSLAMAVGFTMSTAPIGGSPQLTSKPFVPPGEAPLMMGTGWHTPEAAPVWVVSRAPGSVADRMPIVLPAAAAWWQPAAAGALLRGTAGVVVAVGSTIR